MDTAVLGDEDVFKDGLGLPQTDVLEGAGDAQLGDLIGSGLEDVLVIACVFALVQLLHLALGVIFDDLVPLEVDGAVGRGVDAGDDVEGSGFACAVGANQGNDLVPIDLQVHIVNGYHAAKLHGYIFHTEDVFAHFTASFFSFRRWSFAFQSRNFSGNSLSPMIP